MEDEICPYATFHLLGFREEMDPSKAMQFQTFPHPGNGHSGTMGPPVGHPTNASAHSRSGSQSMVSKLFLEIFPSLINSIYWIKFLPFFYSHVKMVVTLEFHPKEVAAEPITSSLLNTMTRQTALLKKINMALNTDNTALPMIIMDLVALLDVAV